MIRFYKQQIDDKTYHYRLRTLLGRVRIIIYRLESKSILGISYRKPVRLRSKWYRLCDIINHDAPLRLAMTSENKYHTGRNETFDLAVKTIAKHGVDFNQMLEIEWPDICHFFTCQYMVKIKKEWEEITAGYLEYKDRAFYDSVMAVAFWHCAAKHHFPGTLTPFERAKLIITEQEKYVNSTVKPMLWRSTIYPQKMVIRFIDAVRNEKYPDFFKDLYDEDLLLDIFIAAYHDGESEKYTLQNRA